MFGTEFGLAFGESVTVGEITITGQNIAITKGNVTNTNNTTISGISLQSNLGTVVPSIDLSIPLSGESFTSNLGNIFASISNNVLTNLVNSFQSTLLNSSSANLSQNLVSQNLGNLNNEVFATLSGVLVSNSSGNIAISNSKSLIGDNITAALGILSPITGIFVVLTGQSISSVQENLLTNTLLTIDGVSQNISLGNLLATSELGLGSSLITGSLGDIAVNLTNALLGLNITLTQGNLSVQIAGNVIANLTGSTLTSYTSTLVPNNTINLLGNSISLTQELIFSTLATLGNGQSITIIEGTTAINLTKTLSGENLLFGQGIIAFAASDIIIALSGQDIVTTQGTITLLGGLPKHVTKVYIGNQDYIIYILE